MGGAGADRAGKVLVFAVGGARLAIALELVEKAALAAAVIPLPEAPASVLGAVDWSGRILPVLSMRRRLHLPERELSASDRFVAVRYSRRIVVLAVDEILGVQDMAAGSVTEAAEISPDLGPIIGTAMLEGGISLIVDPELFLSGDEERSLEAG